MPTCSILDVRIILVHRQEYANQICYSGLILGPLLTQLADDNFSCIFGNEKFGIFIKISLKFVPKGPIDNNPALV